MILDKDINVIKRDAKLIKELASLYYLTFKKRMKVECGACHLSSYIELKQALNHTTMKDKCNFKLKVSNIRAFGSTNLYTNDTLTDEVAIEYIKQNKNRIGQFSEYPENIEELISDKKAVKKRKSSKKAGVSEAIKEVKTNK